MESTKIANKSGSACDLIIFIVGNSRSGTTMMRRILGNHSTVHMLEELHFFEQLWSTADKRTVLNEHEATSLASKLFFIQRDGHNKKIDLPRHWEEASEMVNNMEEQKYAHEVFREFLFHETSVHQKSVPCEKTPQDVFYIAEILELYPSAMIVNMVRDPRGILLSQKRKWQRKNMGASEMTKKQQRRLRINYHPITISKLWNSSQKAALRHAENSRVHTVIFENLLNNPAAEVTKLCQFLGIEFQDSMLKIPQVGSSNETDSPSSIGFINHKSS